MSKETCNALSSLNKTWAPLFEAARLPFTPPKLVFYSRAGRSGCGTAQSAMGPFYCPEDQGIYLDTDFYQQMDQQLGATGQFARDYVIAHEYGHHLQKLLGMSDRVVVMRNPQPNAGEVHGFRYESLATYDADATVSPLAAPAAASTGWSSWSATSRTCPTTGRHSPRSTLPVKWSANACCCAAPSITNNMLST